MWVWCGVWLLDHTVVCPCPVTVLAVTSLEVVLVRAGVALAIMVVVGLRTLGPPLARARRFRTGRQ